MDGSGPLVVVQLRQARLDGLLDRFNSLAKIDAAACGVGHLSLDA